MSVPTKKAVQKVIDELISPRMVVDGGGVELVDVTAEGVVKVRPQGCCKHCPGWSMTLTMGVEKILKYNLPDVKSVIAVV